MSNRVKKQFQLKTILPLLICFCLCPNSGRCNSSTNLETGSAKNPGFSYHHDEVKYVPWSIHYVKVDRSATDLEIQTMFGRGTKFGLTTLSEQIHSLPHDFGKAMAAINGDFYDKIPPYTGDPKGLQISRGELVSAPEDWSCLWIDASGNLQMGKIEPKFEIKWSNGTSTPFGLNERRSASKAVLYTHAVGTSTHTSNGRELVLEITSTNRAHILQVGEDYTARVVEARNSGNTTLGPDSLVLSIGPDLLRKIPKIEAGDTLQLSTATIPSIKGATAAISGGPALVHEKKTLYNASQAIHPRSAVGWNKDFFYFVEVDGRQPGVSIGMTYAQLATYMKNLGCDEALNLDGGGSSTLWMLGQVMNTPSEGDERGVANGLVLIQKNKSEHPTQTSLK
jgi:hypothetical protein